MRREAAAAKESRRDRDGQSGGGDLAADHDDDSDLPGWEDGTKMTGEEG